MHFHSNQVFTQWTNTLPIGITVWVLLLTTFFKNSKVTLFSLLRFRESRARWASKDNKRGSLFFRMSIGNSIDLYYSAVHLSVIYPLIISRLIISRRLPMLHLNFARMCHAPARGRGTAVTWSSAILRTSFKLHLDQKQLRDTFTLSHHNFVCTISIPIGDSSSRTIEGVYTLCPKICYTFLH